MGASAGYNHVTNFIGVYGVPGIPSPNVGSIAQNPYLAGTVTFNGQTGASSTPVAFDTLGASINDCKMAMVNFSNLSGQTITGIEIDNVIKLAPATTLWQTVTIPYPYMPDPVIKMAASTGFTDRVFIPITKPFDSGTISVKFTTAAPAYGPVPFRVVFICADGPFIPAPAPPLTVTLTTATATQLIGSTPTGTGLYLVSIMAGNTSSTQTRLDLMAGAAGTPFFSMPLAANGGGFEKRWTKPFPVMSPSDFSTQQLYGQLSTAVTDIRVNIEYLIGP